MTTARPAPLVPPEALADWLRDLRYIAEDAETQRLPHTVIAGRIRELLDDMRAVAYRKDPR